MSASNYSLGDRLVLKLKSGVGFDSTWELKSNFPIDREASAENLGALYGEGTFLVADKFNPVNVMRVYIYTEDTTNEKS